VEDPGSISFIHRRQAPERFHCSLLLRLTSWLPAGKFHTVRMLPLSSSSRIPMLIPLHTEHKRRSVMTLQLEFRYTANTYALSAGFTLLYGAISTNFTRASVKTRITPQRRIGSTCIVSRPGRFIPEKSIHYRLLDTAWSSDPV
jgi:hypothetical protein